MAHKTWMEHSKVSAAGVCQAGNAPASDMMASDAKVGGTMTDGSKTGVSMDNQQHARGNGFTRGGFTRGGFTLVELLVVIGIIALLISLLLPTLTRARERAKATVCMSNMRGIGQQLLIYAQNNNGWLFPVGPWMATAVPARYESLGTNKYPWDRWPMHAGFDFTAADTPDPSTWGNVEDYNYNSAGGTYGSKISLVQKWTPPVMRCPADDPPSGHSYILNKYLQQSPEQLIKMGRHANKGSSEVILMGEKVTARDDYYMELNDNDAGQALDLESEFLLVVEPQRHGQSYGSNYLFLDWHVDHMFNGEAQNAVDPWYVAPEGTPATPTP